MSAPFICSRLIFATGTDGPPSSRPTRSSTKPRELTEARTGSVPGIAFRNVLGTPRGLDLAHRCDCESEGCGNPLPVGLADDRDRGWWRRAAGGRLRHSAGRPGAAIEVLQRRCHPTALPTQAA